MLISCIIPTYEKFIGYLYESIGSVFCQDYDGIELIITDDASTNFDQEAIEQYIIRNKGNNIVNYKVLHHEHNLGTVGNLNKAISQASGEIIMILSSDDRFHSSDVISRIVERFADTQCDVLVCSRMKCSEDLKKEVRLMPHPSYVKLINTKLDTAQKQFKALALERSYEFASGAAMYYRKQYIDSFQGYDNRFILWEDGPFISRTTRTGTCIQTAYDIISVDYRSGGVSSRKSKKEKSKTQSTIAVDYSNLIRYEFMTNLDRFTFAERSIIKGNLERRLNNDTYSVNIIMKHPASFVNHMAVKARKLIMRIGKS